MYLGTILTHLGRALGLAFAMFWEILWALIPGFTLSNGMAMLRMMDAPPAAHHHQP